VASTTAACGRHMAGTGVLTGTGVEPAVLQLTAFCISWFNRLSSATSFCRESTSLETMVVVSLATVLDMTDILVAERAGVHPQSASTAAHWCSTKRLHGYMQDRIMRWALWRLASSISAKTPQVCYKQMETRSTSRARQIARCCPCSKHAYVTRVHCQHADKQ
jgi:hypothetical protein